MLLIFKEKESKKYVRNKSKEKLGQMKVAYLLTLHWISHLADEQALHFTEGKVTYCHFQ